MTEGDRICPYCIKPLREVWSTGRTNNWRCDPCKISVTITEDEVVEHVKVPVDFNPMYQGEDEAQSDSCWPDD